MLAVLIPNPMNPTPPLTDRDYLLEKFSGKGGWTYARIPEIAPDKHAHFGWVRVRGTIDQVEIKGYHLMPMGNGCLFLPVKAEIRKKIGKQEGDTVRVVLYADHIHTELPEELRLCLMDVPNAYEAFMARSDSEQRAAIEWVYSSKTDRTKVNRIAKLINSLT